MAAALSLSAAAALESGYQEKLDDMLARISPAHRQVRHPAAPPQKRSNAEMQILKEGGIEALECRMRDEAEARRPPFQRPQSKYSYYFAWMSGRITERFPALEEPERDQMLLMDSGQLDRKSVV